MNDVIKPACRKTEGSDVPPYQADHAIACKVRRLLPEGFGIPGKHNGLYIQLELVVCMHEAFQQPGSYKSGTACNEQPFIFQAFPQGNGMPENDLKILFYQLPGANLSIC